MKLSDEAISRLQHAVDEPDLTGTQYRCLRRIGQGGMATIYLVYDSQLDREVTMKVLSVPDASGNLITRMQREAAVLARLEHPGIVPIHDVGILPDQRPYYVMKYVHGKRLDEYAAQVESIPDKSRVFQRICEAVAFAHSHGIVHRDLKPQNIMVGAFGEVLVMDWGIAKLFYREDPEDRGSIMGTPLYMSPEQATGDAKNINELSDVYGLGAILYFLLTGSAPIRSEDFVVTPPRQMKKDVPKLLQAVCLKAMSRLPQDRYENVTELSKDVQRYLDGQPVRAYRENPFEIAARWTSRNYFLVILILTYLFVRTLLLYFTGR